MYIDTHTPETMMASICKILHVTQKDIQEVLAACYQMFQLQHPILFVDHQYDFLQKFVRKHQIHEIQEVYFFSYCPPSFRQ